MRVLNRAKNYTHTADGTLMNRVLTALACLTLLLVSVPLTSAQAPTAAISMTCDQKVHEFTDSLTNQSIVVVCTVSNPTTYQEKISFSSGSSEFGVQAEDVYVGGNQELDVNITLTSLTRVGMFSNSSVIINASVVEINSLPPVNTATSSGSVIVHEGDYNSNNCATSAISTVQYIVFEIHERINGSMSYIGDLTLDLNHTQAPIHASNFALLSEMGCYNNVTFHRVIDGFMIQSGDFTNGDGTGGHSASWHGYCNGQESVDQSNCNSDGWTMPDESSNNLTHIPYSLSMSKTSNANTGGSQFFIVDNGSTPSHLNGVHTVFGKVHSGFGIVDYISQVSTAGSQGSMPVNDLVITHAYLIVDDQDNDGIEFANDSCPSIANPLQSDLDNDGWGDACDLDIDGDGIDNVNDVFPYNDTEVIDSDSDGIGDSVDPDDDNDGYNDTDDDLPLNPNEHQDNDGDGIGNNADLDDDNDGFNDTTDSFPFDANESIDSDNDGVGNNADADDDNDGLNDTDDAFPLDPSETLDTDGDGIGNNADADDDGDGIEDTIDNCQFVANPDQADADGDGVGTACDGNEGSSSSESESVPSIGLLATSMCLLGAALLVRRD